jgi:hypothetical protein
MADEPTNEATDTEAEPSAPVEDEAAKWKALARKHEQQAKANADAAKRLAELEEADKSELEKLAEARSLAEKRAADAESASLRLEVALDKAPAGMGVAQVRKLAKRLAGSTREELEADASELFAEFAAPASDEEEPTAPPPRKPVAKLPGGKNPTSKETGETDPLKIAFRRLHG